MSFHRQILFTCLVVVLFLVPSPAVLAQEQTLTYQEVRRFGRGNARQLEWNPDGSLLAVASDGGVWIYTDQLEDVTWLEDSEYANVMSWSPDGSQLAVAVAAWGDVKILIWNTDDWTLDSTLPEVPALDIVWHPDSSQLAMQTSETIVTLWDLAASNSVLSIENEWPIRAVAWNPDGSQLLIAGIERGSFDFEITTWDAVTGSKLTHLISDTYTGTLQEAPLTPPESTAPQGQDQYFKFMFDHFWLWALLVFMIFLFLVTGLVIVLTRIKSRIVKWLLSLVAIMGLVGVIVVAVGSILLFRVFLMANFPSQEDISTVTAAFSDDGTYLAVGGWYGHADVWDLDSGQRISRISLDEDNYSTLGTVSSFAWSHDGNFLAIACYEGTLLWDRETEKFDTLPSDPEIQNLYGGIYVDWSADDSRIAAIYWEIERSSYRILTWDAATRQLAGDLPADKQEMGLLAWSPGGDQVAAKGGDSLSSTDSLFIWDVNSGELLQTLDTKSVRIASWKPDNSTLLVLNYDMGYQIEEWDVPAGQRTNVAPLKFEHRSYLEAITWDPEANYLALANDSNILIWDNSGQLLHTLTGHSDRILSLAWSQDGRYLASASGDASVRLWDISTGKLVTVFKEHDYIVNDVIWSPDGQRIASTDNYGRLLVWYVATHEITYELEINKGMLAWSPDGKLLVLGGCTNLICSPGITFWDADTGETLAQIEHILGGVYWSSDGGKFATNGSGVIRIWALEDTS